MDQFFEMDGTHAEPRGYIAANPKPGPDDPLGEQPAILQIQPRLAGRDGYAPDTGHGRLKGRARRMAAPAAGVGT